MNALRRLVSALRTTGAEGPSGMSVAQQFALRVISRHPGLTMTELAVATLTTRSTVSEVVIRLVDRGLISREQDVADRRRIRLTLTRASAETVTAIGETLPERLVLALDALGPATTEALAQALEGWVLEAGLHEVAPAMFGEPSPAARPKTSAA